MSNKPVIKLKDLINYHFKIDDNPVNLDLLPIYHTLTDKNFVRYYAKDPILKPNPKGDKNFNGDKLLCFFYGKAVYWPAENQENAYKLNNPVTIGYSVDRLNDINPKRILPFDSGGVFNKRLECIDADNIIDYELPPNYEGIKKYVKLFYKNNNNYLECSEKFSFRQQDFPLCDCVKELKKLHTTVDYGVNDVKYGEQAFTIEVQYQDEKIEVKPSFVIFPQHLINSEKALNQLRKLFPDNNETRIISYPSRDKKMSIEEKFINMRNTVKNISKNNNL